MNTMHNVSLNLSSETHAYGMHHEIVHPMGQSSSSASEAICTGTVAGALLRTSPAFCPWQDRHQPALANPACRTGTCPSTTPARAAVFHPWSSCKCSLVIAASRPCARSFPTCGSATKQGPCSRHFFPRDRLLCVDGSQRSAWRWACC